MSRQGLGISFHNRKPTNYQIGASRRLQTAEGSSNKTTDPPHYLVDDIALDEWKRVAPHLATDGTLTSARFALLVGYCTAVAKAVRAEETLLREGRYYETETNSGSVMRRRHPAAQDAEQAWSSVRKFAKQLGLATADDDDGSERRAIFK
jgi:P27 family predicted phage terminase small subunit